MTNIARPSDAAEKTTANDRYTTAVVAVSDGMIPIARETYDPRVHVAGETLAGGRLTLFTLNDRRTWDVTVDDATPRLLMALADTVGAPDDRFAGVTKVDFSIAPPERDLSERPGEVRYTVSVGDNRRTERTSWLSYTQFTGLTETAGLFKQPTRTEAIRGGLARRTGLGAVTRLLVGLGRRQPAS